MLAASASPLEMFVRRPRTNIIAQSMVEPVANKPTNLNQFIPVVRNHSKKNDKGISSRVRLTVPIISVKLVSHIQVEFK